MTTFIVETVSSTTPTIPFTDVWDRDLLIVAIKLWDDGTTLVGAEPPPGWGGAGIAGTETGAWVMPTDAASLSYTFTIVHATAQQLLGLHLRSDLVTGPDALNTRQSVWGVPATTIGTADALIGTTWVRDEPIALTTPGFVLIDQTSHVAFWRHEPLQVPPGTTFMAMSSANTPAVIDAWRAWGGGAPPVEPAGAGGWGVWIID